MKLQGICWAVAGALLVLSNPQACAREVVGTKMLEGGVFVEDLRLTPSGNDDDPTRLFLLRAEDGASVQVGTPERWVSLTGGGDVIAPNADHRLYLSRLQLEGSLEAAGRMDLYLSPFVAQHAVKEVFAHDFRLHSGTLAIEGVTWGGVSNGNLLRIASSEHSGSGDGDRTIAVVKAFEAPLDDDFATLQVQIDAGGVLAVGEEAYRRFASQGTAGTATLKRYLSKAQAAGTSHAVLVTTSWQPRLGERVWIRVGESETAPLSADSRVIVGSQGQWLVDLARDGAGGAESVERSARDAGDGPVSVVAESGAQLVLVNWDGRELNDVRLDASWDAASILLLSTPYLGQVGIQGGSLTLRRRPWGSLPGLASREVVQAVEDVRLAQDAESFAQLGMGYQYVAHVVSSAGLGVSPLGSEAGTAYRTIAEVIDAGTFLAGASGLLTASDYARRRTHEALAEHEPELLSEDGDWYWWASAYGGKGSMDGLRSGTDWGFDEDVYGGTLGADWRLASDFLTTFAVSGATSDITSSGRHQTASASLTLAAAGASLTYRLGEDQALNLTATYSETQGEAKKLDVDYRIKTEPKIKAVSVSAGWSARYALNDQWWLKPRVYAGMERVRFSEGDAVVSVRDGTRSGTGFVQTASDRRLYHAKGQLETMGRLTCFGYAVEPGLRMGLALYAGDTNWKLTTRLSDGDAASSETFRSLGRWNLSAGLSLAVSDAGRLPVMEGGIFGFGAKKTDKTTPYAWKLALFAAAETGAYGHRSVSAGLRYRELF